MAKPYDHSLHVAILAINLDDLQLSYSLLRIHLVYKVLRKMA